MDTLARNHVAKLVTMCHYNTMAVNEPITNGSVAMSLCSEIDAN